MSADSPPARLSPLLEFRHVLAGASPNRETPGVDWPEFEQQDHARLWRRRGRVCTRPARLSGAVAKVTGRVAFVSMHDNHFGHIVAETMPRLPQLLTEEPDLPLWFSSNGPMDYRASSAAFRAVTGWLGIQPERIRFFHRPTEFKSLAIAAQAEHLDGPPPPAEYLHRLETLIPSRFRPSRPHAITFVTREGLSPDRGRQAGEGYLADCLRGLGVQVIRPELLSLEEQMRIYAESRHLIFSEGSAVHGRQLLGRIDQDVTILRRRFRSHMAQGQIEPRCRSLTYVPCFGGALFVIDRLGRKVLHAQNAQYTLPPLFDFFDGLGLPLEKVWDHGQFAARRDADVLAWAEGIFGDPGPVWGRPVISAQAVLDQLPPLGLGHLNGPITAILRRAGLETPAPARPNAAPPLDYVATQGEQGLDLYVVRRQGDALVRYHCVARWKTQGKRPELHLHEPLPEAGIRALARLAPRAAPVGQDHPLSRARARAERDAGRLVAALEDDAEALRSHPQLQRRLQTLYAHNLMTSGLRAARQLQPAVARALDRSPLPAEQGEAMGYILRMLGDLASRAGDAAMAHACHATSIRAGGENPHRRAKLEAAAAAIAAG